MNIQTDSPDRAEQVALAFEDACAAWVGCDWPMLFGGHHLKLENMTSAHLELATCGLEPFQGFLIQNHRQFPL